MYEAKEVGVCCETCQLYGTCEIKWRRGERGERDVCCKLCNHHEDCLIEKIKKAARLKKKNEDSAHK